MGETKSMTLTVRIQPAVKEGLRAVAEQERRSLANMIEVMIRARRYQRGRENGTPLNQINQGITAHGQDRQ